MVTVKHEQTWVYRCPYCDEPQYLTTTQVLADSIEIVCPECNERYKAEPPKEKTIR